MAAAMAKRTGIYALTIVAFTAAAMLLTTLRDDVTSSERRANGELAPRVFDLGVPEPHSRIGGIFAADLDSEPRKDFVITGTGFVAAYSGSGMPLWVMSVDVQVSSKAESDGLPGLHAPGAQAADIDGNGKTRVLFLTRDGNLRIVDGRSGEDYRTIPLPAPHRDAERWEHLVVANLRGQGDRDLILQATNKDGYRIGRFVAAYAIDDLLAKGEAATALWARNDFLANAHNGLRIADLDGDGRHETLGGDIVGPTGERLFRLPLEGHLDSLYVDDVRPDLPGLEVVGLEEGGPQRVFLYNKDGLIWQAHYRHQEPQNAVVGDFDPGRPGLEIWCRSRYDRGQRPWVFDAYGELIGGYNMDEVAPKGWTGKGVEEIFPIQWTGDHRRLAAAKERHEAGHVALFDPLSGTFLLRLDERAHRLYVADVSGDWREEIIVMNGGELHIYENPAPNLRPDRPRLWDQDHYRRSKMTWTYYST